MSSPLAAACVRANQRSLRERGTGKQHRFFSDWVTVPLEARQLLTLAITELPFPLNSASANELVKGSDGALWSISETFNSQRFDDDHFLVRFDTATGAASTFRIDTTARFIQHLTSGPDGNLWFLEDRSLVKFTLADHSITRIPMESTDALGDLITGPDNKLWFVTSNNDVIQAGKLDTSTGVVTRYTAIDNLPIYVPGYLSVGPDQKLYFLTTNTQVVSITTNGQVATHSIPAAGELNFAPDHSLWVPDYFGNRVLHLNSTTFATIKSYPLPNGSQPISLTFATDGTVWVAQSSLNQLAQINPTNDTITQYVLPSTRDSYGTLVGEYAETIVTGPDGNLWYTQDSRFSRIGVVRLAQQGPSGGFQTTEGGTIPFELTAPPRVVSAAIVSTAAKKGAPKKFSGFKLVFSSALDAATARNVREYILTATVKSGKKTTQKPVAFKASLDASGKVVTLTISAKSNPFAKGGKLTVSTDLRSVGGYQLDFARTFAIAANAKTIK